MLWGYLSGKVPFFVHRPRVFDPRCSSTDRYGRRPMLLAGIGATFFMIILFGMSRSFAMAGKKQPS